MPPRDRERTRRPEDCSVTEFGTEAVFEATVSPSSLREAKQTVEDELGGMEVQIDVQTGAGSGTRAGGRRPGAGGLAREIEVEHGLSRTRNDLLRDLVDAQEQGNFDRAVSGGGLGGAAGLLAGGVGLTLGAGAIGLAGLTKALNSFDPGSVDVPPIPPLKAPDIPPVPVDAPGSIPVDAPSSIPVDAPSSIPLDAPSSIPLTRPSGTGSGAPRPSPGPGPAPSPEPTPGTDPRSTNPSAPYPYDVFGPDARVPSPSGDGGDGVTDEALIVGGTALAGAGAAQLAKGSSSGAAATGGTATGIGAPTFIPALAGRARRAEETAADERTFFERILARLTPDVNQGRREALRGRTPTATATASISKAEPPGNGPQINHSPTYNIQGVKDLKRQQQRDIRELERKLQKLERALGGRGR